MVKDLPSGAGDAGSIPVRELRAIPCGQTQGEKEKLLRVQILESSHQKKKTEGGEGDKLREGIKTRKRIDGLPWCSGS